MSTWTIGKRDLVPADVDARDPRGIVWMWEEPKDNAQYILGCDPTVGITGWNRYMRSQDDSKIDNAAIEIVHVGNPDVQVAEYAAPHDAVELADVCNVLGRVYGGNHEDAQALAIIEIQPGPGWMTQRELVNRLGYTNFFVWKYQDTFIPKSTTKLGWFSSRQSVRDLWVRGLHHINSHRVRVNSPWLIEEMSDCERDDVTMALKAIYGRHDDRVRAFLLALWAAHDWSLAIEPTEEASAVRSGGVEWQRSDTTLEEMMSAWDERFAEVTEKWD